MIIVAPLAYLAASYYNGQDGIANIKRLIGIESNESPVSNEEKPLVIPKTEDPKDEAEIERMREELEYSQRRLEDLKKENERLKKEIWEKQQKLSDEGGAEQQ
jgi:peptidoglycan hydrolase CwlO-like protein